MNSLAEGDFPVSDFNLNIANVDLTPWTEDIRVGVSEEWRYSRF